MGIIAPVIDPERFQAAASRFRAFFEELRGAFVEREDVLAQIALALLAKEHVLLAGPPGTAKSGIASAVFGRIVCEDTGSPSLFSRQITESTVQTDLIGPVDFKNLTETGRTTHFTDEGILGAAHAFLDEVFDGRDMLLRSALNVLQERELKQGSTVTRGRTECAMMTSNRYVSEVLEQSRETLLAFVDRIAFIGFVPRAFANPENLATVLKRRVGGTGRMALDALLTIQDLDVLQAAVNEVWVAPELCDAVAHLLATFDAEVASASRADPAFVPTRYISTRTAVRCASLVRATMIFDKIFSSPTRPLEARREDLTLLRLHLVLSGPTPEQTSALLDREADPTERRQLELLRTERALFDACLEKLPSFKLTPRPRPQAPPPPAAKKSQPGGKAAPPSKKQSSPPPPPPVDRLADLTRGVDAATAKNETDRLLYLAREIAKEAREGEPDHVRARALLDRATAALGASGLAAALALAHPEADLMRSVRGLAELAASLEDGTASMHPVAAFMQQRALDAIVDLATHGAGIDAATIERASGSKAFEASVASQRILERVALLAELRQKLLARASTRPLEADQATWDEALDRVEGELVAVWARSFAEASKDVIDLGSGGSLGEVLGVLGPELARLDVVDEKLALVRGGHRGRVKERVVGVRLEPLVSAALARTDVSDRALLVATVRDVVSTLRGHDLAGALTPTAWLTLVARTLSGAERERDVPPGPHDVAGYRALRAAEQRTALACTLAEVALVVAAPLATAPGDGALGGLAATLALVPADVRSAVAAADVARTGRAVGYLERWWAEVSASADAGKKGSLTRSSLLEILWDEGALARFALETRLLEELLPEVEGEAAALRGRLEALDDAVRDAGLALVNERADLLWKKATSGR